MSVTIGDVDAGRDVNIEVHQVDGMCWQRAAIEQSAGLNPMIREAVAKNLNQLTEELHGEQRIDVMQEIFAVIKSIAPAVGQVVAQAMPFLLGG